MLASALAITGCASRVVVTPEQPATTNAVTGVITPAVPAVITNIPNETATKVIGYGNAVLPFVPAPYGDLLALLLGAAAGVTGFIAKRANAKTARDEATIATIVKGVEAAGEAASAVKVSISNTALARGTSDAVQAAVDKNVA